MQLKTIVPSHRTFPFMSVPLEDTIGILTLVFAHRKKLFFEEKEELLIQNWGYYYFCICLMTFQRLRYP